MKIREDFKGLKNQMSTEMGKAISNVDPSSHADFMTDAGEMIRSVDEQTPIIRKSLKKGIGKKMASKSKMKLPTGKLFGMSKVNEISKKEIQKLIENGLT